MGNKNNQYNNRWNVFKENYPTSHIAVSLIIVNILFILFSAVLISILPENRGRNLFDILRLAFTLMVNPSGKYIYSEAPISLIITTVVVLLGMISLTGGTVGFITSIIQGILEKNANNKRALRLKDHIVILNYNNKVPSILFDYSFDDVKNTYIVILTGEDKQKVLHEIDNMYECKGRMKRFKNVIVREGNPMSALDLDKINLKDARTVLLMSPEGEHDMEEAGFQVSKLFVFVNWYFSQLPHKKHGNIVVETSNPNMDEMIRNYDSEVEDADSVAVNHREIIGKMLALSTLMPSINSVMKQLFSFEGVEIYMEEPKEKLSIREELAMTKTALPLFDQNGKRVYIAEDESEIFLRREPFSLTKTLPENKCRPEVSFEKTEIVIVGTNSKLPYILESFLCYKKEYDNEKLHVILADTPDREELLKELYENEVYKDILMPEEYSYIIVKDIYHPMEELGKIISERADSILFLSDDCTDTTRMDEKPLLYWTNLKQKIKTNRQVDLIVEILDSQNQSIVQQNNKSQIIVSDDFLGHFYAQLGKNPARLNVMKDFLTSNGDSASITSDNMLQDEGDLLCMRVSELFTSGEKQIFASKRELILWMYEYTGETCIPIGVIKDGVDYIFARTDGKKVTLDDAVLLGVQEDSVYRESEGTGLILHPEDELIIFMTGKGER